MFRTTLIFLAISGCFFKESLCDVKYVDLTWTFDESSIYWFGMKSFTVTKDIAGYTDIGNRSTWFAYKEFCGAEHGGTHIDAPYHFYQPGWKVSDIPLDHLIGPGMVIDVSKEAEQYGINATLDVHHLEEWVRINGEIPKNTIMLVKFGWSKYYSNKLLYIGTEEHPNFPGLSLAAAQWIVDNGNIVGIGLDVPSPDPGPATEYFVHYLFTEKRIFILENVKMMEHLPARGFKLIALPMNIKGGSGGPVRIVAEVPLNCQ